jgi:hypothetical protein
MIRISCRSRLVVAALCGAVLVLASATSARGGTDSSYGSSVLSDGASSFWQLDETSGSTFADAGAAGLDGAWSGSPDMTSAGPIACDSESAITLDGSSQAGSVAYDPSLDFTNQMTIEAWVKVPGSVDPSAVHPIIEKPLGAGENESNLISYALRLNGSTPEVAFGGSATDSFQLDAADPLGAGWHQVVATFNDGGVDLYIDGNKAAEGEADFSELYVHGTEDLNVGADQFGDYFDGSLAEVAVYPSSLGADLVYDHYVRATTDEGDGCKAQTLVTGTIPDASSGTVTALAWPDQATVDALGDAGDDIPLTPVAEGSISSDGSFTLSVASLTAAGVDGTSDGSVNFTLLANTGSDTTVSAFSDSVDSSNTVVGAIPEVAASDAVSLGSSSYSCTTGCFAKREAILPDRNNRIGEIMVGNHTGFWGKFHYVSGANSELGVAVSFSGAFGSWSLGGTAGSSTSVGEDFLTRGPGARVVYFEGWAYAKYSIWQVPARGPVVRIDYEDRPYQATGGFAATTGASPPAANVCRGVTPGVWKRSTNKFETFSSGMHLADLIGIDVSARTGASTSAWVEYNIPASGGRMCGSNTYPASAGRVQSLP